jgi:predicted metal-dependent enzyme (double-stranded beta helix superfamily)
VDEHLSVSEFPVPRYVSELVKGMESGWLNSGGQLAELPKAAAAVLSQIGETHFTALDFLSYVATVESSGLPLQSALSDHFGQPPIVLYASEDFFIQALTWMEGSTAIHQHGFSGAFKVIEGQSLHVSYEFDSLERLAPKLQVGDLKMRLPEILNPGDVRTIESGSDFIHALFHLVRPSVTIVIRNFKTDVGGPQYNYRSPGVASAPPDNDVLRGRRLQAVSALHTLHPDKALEAACQMASSEDVWGALQVSDHCFGLWGWNDRFLALLDALVKRHRALGVIAPMMYEEQWRSEGVLRRRTLLHEPHQRTFLALLANLPSRFAIESVLNQIAPDRASDELLMEWIEELASPQLRGVSGLSLSDDERTELRLRLRGDSLTDSLGTLSGKFDRPSILNHLIF